jgi:hypothetical protein
VDDLELLVDGKPIWDVPRVERTRTSLDLDREFDGGSRVKLSALSQVQVDNLVLLGKVWGFLKYHHPVVTSGERHWDYELFRALPEVLAAENRQAAQSVLVERIRGLGDPAPCSGCPELQTGDLHQRPRLDWIRQESVLGRDLSGLLDDIYKRQSRARQFYVSLAPARNPVFENEPGYLAMNYPDAGYQLLALYRFWNIIEYWFPNRDIMDGDWDSVLAEFVPRLALAQTRDAYQLELLALIARITDTHANLSTIPGTVRPPAGTCQLPVVTRFVEERAVVTGFSSRNAGAASDFMIGDVIEGLDGVPVSQLIERWLPYYPASNQPARLRDIASTLTRGVCGQAQVDVRRPEGVVTLRAARLPLPELNLQLGATHDLPGETLRLMSNDVAYLKLSSVKAAESETYVRLARDTRGLVVDIRNYPSEFVVYTLGGHLVDKPTPFALPTIPDLQHPGAFRWAEPVQLTPRLPRYSGKVVVLVDETSISQAEFTAMALRASAQTKVVGSTTAGADGNVSRIILPGGQITGISGLGVFYPGKQPTQRVGIVPDIEVRPTIAGVRAGRDEVLEAALREILGPEVSSGQIQEMARP